MFKSKYTDKVDVSTVISLHEYGIIRDPKTTKTILMMFNNKGIRMAYSCFISLDDVRDALNDQDHGFFDWMGIKKQDTIQSLDNDHLANFIMSLNDYSGWFN